MIIRITDCAAEVAKDQIDEAIIVNLVDERFRRLAGAAPRDRMDDAERVEEGIDRVDDQQEERRRRQQRKDDGPEALGLARAINGGGFDQRFRDRLQAGDEEQEIVADLLPCCRGNDKHHRLIAVEQRVPIISGRANEIGERSHRRIEQEEPEHARDGRCNRIGPDHQRTVDAFAADDLVGHDGEQQGKSHGNERGRDGEDHRHLKRVHIVRIAR